MIWILWSTTQHKWVNWPGSDKSFTRDKYKARRFPTREAAEADACGDEIPQRLEL